MTQSRAAGGSATRAGAGRTRTALALVAAALALLAAALAAPPAARADTTPPGCASPLGTGGEWRTYGADLSNTRNQVHEQVLSATDVPTLTTAWVFTSQANGGTGDFTGTPIVADGCVYVASTRGWVFAMNADTGKLVWRTQVPYGGGVNSSVAVADRVVSASGSAAQGGAGTAQPCSPTRKRAAHRRAARRHAARSRSARRRRSARKRGQTCKTVKRKRAKRKHATRARRRARHGTGRRSRSTHGQGQGQSQGSPAPTNPSASQAAGTIYLAVSRTQHVNGCPPGDPCEGPYVVALDQATGHVVWATRAIDGQPGADVYASPIISDGVLMIGVSGGSAELGPEQNRSTFEGSMNFLDASTGRMIKKTYTIHPPKQGDPNLAGGGIWSTPAIDTQHNVAFVGAGNPYRPQAESPHTDAVLKFDVDRSSPHFGDIIGSYKGQVDTYTNAFKSLPCIDTADPTNNAPPYYPQGAGSCDQIDQDFGDSPNLFTDPSGRLLVGDGQKSGVYHVFDAQTMKPVWQTVTGVPSSVGGIVGATAVDGASIYGPDTIPGYVWSLSQAGSIRWIGPISDGAHWGPPVAYANGVVYTIDFSGFLDAFDAQNGVLLTRRPLAEGNGNAQSISWGGVSIARHTIFASIGVLGLANGFIVALRSGVAADQATDIQNTATGAVGNGGAGTGGAGGPSGLQGPSVVAGPGAASTGYATPAVIAFQGGKLDFTNLDVVQHDVTSDQKGPNGAPLFQSKLAGLGEAVPVAGVEKLPPGSYSFYCSVHPGMRGTLIVQ